MKNNLNQIELKRLLESSVYTEQDQLDYNNNLIKSLYSQLSDSEKFTEYLNNNPKFKFHLTSDRGQIKLIELQQKSNQDICIIDWLNFTVNEESFNTDLVLTDSDLIRLVSDLLQFIFGFGISTVRPTGAFFYKRSYELGDGYGLVCHGGQNNTILISLNGTGLQHAPENWESRLYNFLEVAISPTITRIDLAHDIFDADENLIHFYLSEYMNGKFQKSGRPPKINQVGNWLTPNTDGRTLYIGKRTNGLFCRIYEKGYQLQSEDYPNWLRIEVEIKSVDRYLPHDILLRPHEYFAGSYPALQNFSQTFTKLDTIKHEVRADFEHRKKWAKRQTGAFIKLLSELGYTPQQIVDDLEGSKIPRAFEQKFLDNTKSSIHAEPASENANTNPLDFSL
jgi:phage replication initiation protein